QGGPEPAPGGRQPEVGLDGVEHRGDRGQGRPQVEGDRDQHDQLGPARPGGGRGGGGGGGGARGTVAAGGGRRSGRGAAPGAVSLPGRSRPRATAAPPAGPRPAWPAG